MSPEGEPVSFLLFAYGSNMLSGRIRARVRGAEPIGTGYIEERQLAFHKRGRDGSAKADAIFTGSSVDRVWGVLYALSPNLKPQLDQHEIGYTTQQATVISGQQQVQAKLYVAEAESIDRGLKPFDWYHGMVLAGAKEHGLPNEYRQLLSIVKSVPDCNLKRSTEQLKLLREFS